MKLLKYVFFILALKFALVAAEINISMDSIQSKIKTSLQELGREREEHAEKMKPLHKLLHQLKEDEEASKQNFIKLQRQKDTQHISFDELKKEVQQLQKEKDHFDLLLSEFISEEQIETPAFDQHKQELKELETKLEAGLLVPAKKVSSQLGLISHSVDKLNDAVGGQLMKSKVLDEKGKLIEGQVLDLGPESFFYNETERGRLVNTHGERSMLISDKGLLPWIDGETKLLPLDTSGGDLTRMNHQSVTLVEHIKKGGKWVVPILFFACLSSLAGLLKLISLYSIKINTVKVGEKLGQLMSEGLSSEAMSLLEKQTKVNRDMWKVAVENGRADPQLSEDLMAEVILKYESKFESFLGLIAVTASIAPLLGLLGTVTGIIKTFEVMAIVGAGDPKPLILGISEALITTELGLFLAIPALLMYALLSKRSSALVHRMERAGMALVHQLDKPSKL